MADTEYRLAPMSATFVVLTVVVLALPAASLAGSLASGSVGLAVLAVLLAALDAWVWLRLRPRRFVLRSDSLEVIWPWRRRVLRAEHIGSAKTLTARELRAATGWAIRLGAGGLWGGFGWLWTSRRGIVQMYISRGTGLVWIECSAGRPWLVTPERPDEFVAQLLGLSTSPGAPGQGAVGPASAG